MHNPLTLSVVVANYNHGTFLRRSLPALLTQTRLADEWIIIDDASTDDSREIIADFASGQPHITIVHHEQNRGVIFSINEGMRLARGDYVYFAAADDVALPTLFERLMDALVEYPGAGLALADFFLFSGERGPIRRQHVSLATSLAFLDGQDFAHLLLSGLPFHYPPCAAIVHRETLLALSGYDAKAGWLADWWFNLQVGQRRGVCFVPEALAGFYCNVDSFSGAGTKKAPPTAELWSLACDGKNNEAERLWFASMAALPSKVRHHMWRQVFLHPSSWAWGVRHWWLREGWPGLRPWLWPVAQTAQRVCPASFYPTALRAFGATIAGNVHIARGVTVDRPWRLRLDAGAVLETGVKICARFSVFIGARAVIGKNCVIDSSALDEGHMDTDAIIIGPSARIGENSRLYAGATVAADAIIAAHAVLRSDNSPEPTRTELKNILQR
ncbi:MAG TPA: glycosyltransferase [Opitutales bacterium]|jgi:glycosyltransferase involved in cell wall biosynthesis/acetyltransferase-like isoleucine patch superfamily enzyme|nr:glycosyltransferase [Opitutales bacterium]